MMDHIVANTSEYMAFCSRVQGPLPVVFRGQNKDYGAVVPSLFRPNAPKDDKIYRELAVRLYIECFQLGAWETLRDEHVESIEEQYSSGIRGWGWFPQSYQNSAWDWESLGRMMAGEDDRPTYGFGPGPNYTWEDFVISLKASFVEKLDRHDDALLQHYGPPTRALDVSYDPVIALWFAMHRFVRLDDGRATYQLADAEGVVYIFPSGGSDLADLRKVHSHEWDETNARIPYFGLRGVVQEGALLFGATAAKPDLSDRVIHRIRFTQNVWDAEAVKPRVCDYRTVFPLPQSDPFYRALLTEIAKPNSIYAELKDFVPIYC